MMTAQQSRARSAERRWTSIENAIIRATNDGEYYASIIGDISDSETSSLRSKGYRVETVNAPGTGLKKTVISWEAH